MGGGVADKYIPLLHYEIKIKAFALACRTHCISTAKRMSLASAVTAGGAQRTLTGVDTRHRKVLQHHSVLIDTSEKPEHKHAWPPRLVICNPLHLNLAAAAGLESREPVAAPSPTASSAVANSR